MTQPKIIAMWTVASETYQEMINEAIADAQIFMHGFPANWYVDVVNSYPAPEGGIEGSRIILWHGQALITVKPAEVHPRHEV